MRRVLRARLAARGDDAGASAVEFALLFPIFIVLAMGTIAAGTAYSKQLNVTQAAREASRYGATHDIKALTMPVWLADMEKAVKAAAGAANDPMGGYDYYCVAYVVIKSDGTVDTMKSQHLEKGLSPAAGACPSTTPAAIASTDYVQVAVTRNSQFFAIFINPTIQLDSVSVTPYEGKAP